jgi:predicted dehydrogenase
MRIKTLLAAGVIGEVTSVDFHWYLDTRHGADYFRRWHALTRHSGSLFVHKSTHHFDLLNWYLDAVPSEVMAMASQRHYGRNGPYRGTRCRGCAHADACPYHLDISRDPVLEMLYEAPSHEDGYVRDACVFRDEIDIPDTMAATIRTTTGAQVSYSVNTYMPIEGYHLAFNGRGGRLEVRQYEDQPWSTPPADEILLLRNFAPAERIWVAQKPGGHFGGDDGLRDMLFRPGTPDPLRQRAGTAAGVASVLCGVAALQSSRTGQAVALRDLWGTDLPNG